MKELIQKHYEFIAGLIIFFIIVITNMDFYKAIILLLEFIVILEVVKMISDFIEKNKLSLRFIIDIFIIFLIRDIIILVTQPNVDYYKIVFIIFIIFTFFVFRYLAVKHSPSLYKKKYINN